MLDPIYMRAMVLTQAKRPLVLREIPRPKPKKGQLLLKVLACGVCRTDLHIVDGELTAPKLPLILGHQIVGEVVEINGSFPKIRIGDRVGVPWLGGSCEKCSFCTSGKENLCDKALYTGYQTNGGYAEYAVADARFCFPIPERYSATEAAPLLCAGMIGYRALRFTEDAKRIGFYGFGSSAHILIQIARYQKKEVYVFTRRKGDEPQKLAKTLGATWVGTSEEMPPKPLDAAIIFAPVGALVPLALKATGKGGIVVSADIHMSDIPSFPYKLLWEERVLRSVSNLTRKDGKELLAIAPKVPVRVKVTTYPLEEANQALADIRTGKLNGSAVLTF